MLGYQSVQAFAGLITAQSGGKDSQKIKVEKI